MEIETKVISSETIKPSSPTPHSLQNHKLSFLHLLTPPLFLPVVYFYPSNPKIPNLEKTKLLKDSLSETLSRFVGNLYVNCEDGAALFSEAEANCNLPQVIYNPNPKDMTKFLPYKFENPRGFSMAVQATYFRCGGVAVGILISNGGGVRLPQLDGAAYSFPPVDNSALLPARGIAKEEVAARIFAFSADTIALLQKKYSSGGRRPSRVEALSVFIWTRFAAATRARSDPETILAVQNLVKRWGRVDPTISVYRLFSNRFVPATAAVDGGLVGRVEEDEKHLHLGEFRFLSLCGSGVYEADFGWGEPVWVGSPGLARKNMAIFTDAKSGGGVEALVELSQRDMKKFETDLELQIFIETNFGAPDLKSRL